MKYFFILIILFPLITYSQAEQPFKKANVVLVYTKTTIDEAFQKVGQSLINNGYTLDKSNEKFHTFQTNVKPISKGILKANIEILLYASLRTLSTGVTEIKLTGIYGLLGEKPDISIDFRGMKGSPATLAFDNLNDSAQRIAESTSGQVKYAFQ